MRDSKPGPEPSLLVNDASLCASDVVERCLGVRWPTRLNRKLKCVVVTKNDYIWSALSSLHIFSSCWPETNIWSQALIVEASTASLLRPGNLKHVLFAKIKELKITQTPGKSSTDREKPDCMMQSCLSSARQIIMRPEGAWNAINGVLVNRHEELI